MPKEVSKAKRKTPSSSGKIVMKKTKLARNAPLLKLKENAVVEENQVVQMGGKFVDVDGNLSTNHNFNANGIFNILKQYPERKILLTRKSVPEQREGQNGNQDGFPLFIYFFPKPIDNQPTNNQRTGNYEKLFCVIEKILVDDETSVEIGDTIVTKESGGLNDEKKNAIEIFINETFRNITTEFIDIKVKSDYVTKMKLWRTNSDYLNRNNSILINDNYDNKDIIEQIKNNAGPEYEVMYDKAILIHNCLRDDETYSIDIQNSTTRHR